MESNFYLLARATDPLELSGGRTELCSVCGPSVGVGVGIGVGVGVGVGIGVGLVGFVDGQHTIGSNPIYPQVSVGSLPANNSL